MEPESNSQKDAQPKVYMHSPLDPEKREIRLLQAKKVGGNDQGSLRTRMVTTSLLDPTHLPYKALSYVWTDHTPVYDPNMVGKLTLNPSGGNNNTPTPIDKLQQSALTALWQLVDTENILTIWIDAICINQDDIEERGSQVAMMSSIYQDAEEIVAWLGPDSEAYDVGFQVVENMAAFGKKYFEERWFQWCYNSDVPAEDRRADQYYEGANGERIPAWDKVLGAAQVSLTEWFEPDDTNGRPPPRLFDFILMGLSTFWTRAWILQELAFAHKARIQSGNASTTLANFLMATKVWHTLQAAGEYSSTFGSGSGHGHSHWNPGEFAQTLLNRSMVNTLPLWDMMIALLRLREIDNPAVPAPTLTYRLLMSFTNFQATESRDKIFALWGFVGDDPNRELLRPDYNISTEEVFARAAMYMVLTQRNLTVLATHGHGETAYEIFVRSTFQKTVVNTQVLELPSWVPDWRVSQRNSATNQAHIWLNDHHKGKQPIFTDDEFTDLVTFSADSRRLRIRGKEVGEISDVYSGDMFPYSASAHEGDNPDTTSSSFRDRFANFVLFAAHGSVILSQYFRFVFRSAEGATNELFNYETDLSEPIHTMRFLDDGSITVDNEGVFGGRLIKFLMRLIGENDLFGLRASGQDITDAASTEDFLTQKTHRDIAFPKWWDALTGAFDIDTWPESMRNGLKRTTCGANMSEEGRVESMKEVQSWIGTKTFNFFIAPGFSLGICPDCIKPDKGDVVFRPAAHDGPVVLRPVGDGTYKNIGECFVSDSLVRSMDDEQTMRNMMPLLKWVELV